MATSKPVSSATWWAGVGVLLLGVVCGCSGPSNTFAPVEGVVTRNGRPVPRVQVVFFADGDSRGPRATGLTDDAGRFRLVTDDGKEGAPVGQHRVCVIDASKLAGRVGLLANRGADAANKAPQSKPTDKAAAIPPQYARPADTPLRAEVRPGAQTINFQIP